MIRLVLSLKFSTQMDILAEPPLHSALSWSLERTQKPHFDPAQYALRLPCVVLLAGLVF